MTSAHPLPMWGRITLALLTLAVVAGCLAGDAPDELSSASPNGDDDRNATNVSTPVEPGWPSLDEAAIRPGAPLNGGACTVNFVFSSPDNATLYLGSAAHCFKETDLGTNVSIGGVEDAGELAYCSWGTIEEGGGLAPCPGSDHYCEDAGAVNVCQGTPDLDFALVRVADEHLGMVHPAMLAYGGPTHLDEAPEVGEKALTFGSSLLRDVGDQRLDQLDPREGYIYGEHPRTVVEDGESPTFRAYFNPGTVPGDSGSPVVTPEGAAGVLVSVGLAPPGDTGNVVLARALEHVDEETELEVELETWELIDEGVLPAP